MRRVNRLVPGLAALLIAGAFSGMPAHAAGATHCDAAAATSPLCTDSHPTIQAAIDAAVVGDTVLVGNGTSVGALAISKAITFHSLNGPSQTTLRSITATVPILTVDTPVPASGAVQRAAIISGFTFSANADEPHHAIDATGPGTGLLISGNVFVGAKTGIALGANSSGQTIEHNDISASETAVSVDATAHDALIRGNLLHANTTGVSLLGAIAGTGADHVSIVGNTFQGNAQGVRSDRFAGAANDMTLNCLSGNAFGASNDSSNAPLNAIGNYWGNSSGPSGSGPGTGNAVSTNITFSPFRLRCDLTFTEAAGNPVLPRGAGDVFAAAPTMAAGPSSGFLAWYETQVGGTSFIGISSSTDGATWTNHTHANFTGACGCTKRLHPSVTKFSAEYRMYYWAYNANWASDPTNSKLREASSSDGVNWTEQSALETFGLPALRDGSGNIVTQYVAQSVSVTKRAAGGWTGFFEISNGDIYSGYTTNENGRNGWSTFVEAQDADTDCGGRCAHPTVIKDLDGYKMWLGYGAGGTTDAQSEVGFSVSAPNASNPDLFAFTTPAPVFSTLDASVPVWRAGASGQPAAIKNGTDYILLYAGHATGSTTTTLGSAVSSPLQFTPVITSPAAGGVFRSSTFTVNGTAIKGASVTVTTAGQTIVVSNVSSGNWSATFSGVPGGIYTVWAYATRFNVDSVTSAGIRFAVDIAPPSAPQITDPAVDAFLPQRVTITGFADANSTVYITEGGAVIGSTPAASDRTWSKTILFGDGHHVVGTYSVNIAGYRSADSALRPFNVDTVPPAIAITSPDPSGRVAVFGPSTPVKVTGTASDDRGVAAIVVEYSDALGNKVLVDDSRVNTDTLQCLGCPVGLTPTWVNTPKMFGVPRTITVPPVVDGLAPGFYAIRAYAYDIVGNRSLAGATAIIFIAGPTG